MGPHNAHYIKSRGGQDVFVAQFFNGKKQGFFVEIGGNDGLVESNTYFLEHALGWRGMLVEAEPDQFMSMVKNRPSVIHICSCIGTKEDSSVEFKVYGPESGITELLNSKTIASNKQIKTINLPVKRFSTIFTEQNITEIDYLSIDVEGAELDVIASIDFEKVQIHLISLEAHHQEEWNTICEFMEQRNYGLITPAGVLSQHNAFDMFFVNKDYANKHNVKTYASPILPT